MFITTQAELVELISTIEGADILAIDTEFLREKSYFPRLCLLQLATDELQAIVDPLSDIDLSILRPLMVDEKCTKVFHAGDQDRDILFQHLGVPASPVFDTQWAAMVLGMPLQISLAALVKRYSSVELPKADSFSDWSQRPLTDNQLRYARDDVLYLPAIARQMMEELARLGRDIWVREDFEQMADPQLYAYDPLEAWQKVKHTASMSRQQLARVQAVAAWREETARRRDLPKKWVLSDDLIVEIVKRDPQDLASLYHIRGLQEKLNKSWCKEILAALQSARELPEEDWPVRPRQPQRDINATGVAELMNALVRFRARQLHVATSYLANSNDLGALVAGRRRGIGVLRGWRKECIGDELLALLEGRLSLSVVDGEIKVTVVPQ
ncbi:MAG: ribonuclease D [Coriobacteriales bacterium]|nr:ribonuclease D [Coriobacteriales bacterium]